MCILCKLVESEQLGITKSSLQIFQLVNKRFPTSVSDTTYNHKTVCFWYRFGIRCCFVVEEKVRNVKTTSL